MNQEELYCPKCDSREIYDYGDRFECMNCLEEFEKEDFYNLPHDEILSIREKLKIAKIFREMARDSDSDKNDE
jgi:DNA-directed RNA polymerase subunit RPC12/RpoP